jgi:hypothetical protein
MRRDVTKTLRAPVDLDSDLNEPLQSVTWEQMRRIDDALDQVGPFGEVWLIKEGGILKSIRKLDVFNASSVAFR